MERASAVGTVAWVKPPRLVAGGAGLISTTHDFLRYALLLLNQGVLENTNIMAEDTARLAVGDINPPGIAQPSEAARAAADDYVGFCAAIERPVRALAHSCSIN